jgi:glycosyltransferase involved in cell wall biosynthesis
MKILQTLKYYDPCQGGTESVVKNIVEGVVGISKKLNFTVYYNNHIRSFKSKTISFKQVTIIKEATPIYLKSQPLNLRYKALSKVISENDVIHHHYPFPTMELALFRKLKTLGTKKFIITWHANIKNSRWGWIERFYNPLVIKLLDRSDAIVVTSPQLFEASDILKKYKHKIKIIPLSFDPKYSKPESKEYPVNKSFNLLFVGKLRKYKGVEFLIKAIETLPVKLTVVGNGEELANLQEQVKGLNIVEKVIFITNASDEELEKIYQRSDLFVLPSINEAEAFGIVQLEAMANGLPVINTSLKSGVPYVSLNEFSGITVEPKNNDVLKQAIERIISDKLLYEKFSINSLTRSKEFSREKMAQSYLDLYNS